MSTLKRQALISVLRNNLKNYLPSIGTWMQIPSSSVAEILSDAGYDWVVIDLEHASFSVSMLPDLFRAIECGNALPLVRVARGHPKDCKLALDAGSAGVIVPMIKNVQELLSVRDACCWPPMGTRGVGFSRANLYGKYFDDYSKEAQSPILVAMIENMSAVANLPEILNVQGLDAILIGPYDLAASMSTNPGENKDAVNDVIQYILDCALQAKIACGIHVVQPDKNLLLKYLSDGFTFLPYSIDAVFLNESVKKPL